MIARLRARLHGLRRGHEVCGRYDDLPGVTVSMRFAAHARVSPDRYACRGCDRTWTT